jgi:hypothetical protein
LPVTVRTAIKILFSLGAAGALVALSALAWMRYAPRRVPPGQPPLSTLDASTVPAFRHDFNASFGSIRVLALFSPT